MPDPLDRIAALFTGDGAREYLGEPVTVAQHLLQCAALAEEAAALPAVVAAALLHDIGHLVGSGADNHHGDSGAGWLAAWFAPAVTEPVRLHVDAKRYLCAAEPGYLALLSQASRDSLQFQGSVMTPAQATAFETRPYAADAVAVRRWDDAAKDPQARVPGFDHYRSVLRPLLHRSYS